MTTALFDFTPLSSHLFALVWRAISGLALWGLLRLVWRDGAYDVLPTEGGHVTFAPIGDEERHAEVDGDGPVDATFKAIERMASSGARLLLYSVNAITTGTDAQGEVTVRLERDGRSVNGNGADTDILVASAKAYVNALNKLHDKVPRLNPQLTV